MLLNGLQPHLKYLDGSDDREEFLDQVTFTNAETHTDTYGKVFTEETIIEIFGHKPIKNFTIW